MAWSPDTIKDATVLGRPIKAKPFGWLRKTRPALTGPARGGREIWRSGRKNARGAGRTKEWSLKRTRKWAISNRWFSGNFSLALTEASAPRRVRGARPSRGAL